VLEIPVTDAGVAPAQILEKLGGNVLLAIFGELVTPGQTIALESPIFVAETMDLRIKEGAWPIVGNQDVSPAIPVPEYKVWVEPPGEFRVQGIRGEVGNRALPPEVADRMKRHKSFSPALIEAALRAFHGNGKWLPAFDDLAV
jgi:hypothetical protein